MASPTPQEPSFHGVVGRSAKPEVMETASAPNPSVMPLFTSASPAPQLAHTASVPQPVQDPPYSAAQPASPSFSPDPYFIYQQNPGRQKSRPSAQHVPVARHVLENIPSDSPRHVVHQTPPSRVIFSTQSAPSEPRAMRSAAQIQAPTSSQARITKVNHQQEPVASISEKTPFQAHNMQAHVQGAAVAKEASSKSQQKEIHEEQAENVSSQSQHTHTRNQRASTMQTPPQLRHAAILRESVHTRNRSLYSVVPQYHTSPLHREVPQSDPDIRLTAFEGHRGPTTTGFQNLPIYGQPAFVNRQLFASPFQGQAEATSANVRTGNFVGKPLIIDSNDETVPSQGPTTASSNLFHNPLSDGQQGSEFTASQTSTIQNQGQSVHSATIVHGSDIRGQLLSDRDHNPQVQAGTPSAEVGISAVRDVDRTFPYGYAPASDSKSFIMRGSVATLEPSCQTLMLRLSMIQLTRTSMQLRFAEIKQLVSETSMSRLLTVKQLDQVTRTSIKHQSAGIKQLGTKTRIPRHPTVKQPQLTPACSPHQFVWLKQSDSECRIPLILRTREQPHTQMCMTHQFAGTKQPDLETFMLHHPTVNQQPATRTFISAVIKEPGMEIHMPHLSRASQ